MNKQRIFENLEKIIAFEAVARLGSLHRAAEELHISQPSLSVKIKNLEENLEHQFLNRSSKGVSLTSKGKELLEFSKNLMKLSEELSDTLYTKSEIISGVLRLGVYESIGKYFWPKFFKSLNKKNPDLKIQLTVGRSRELIEKLLERDIDLALSIEPPYKKGLNTTEIYSDRFSFYIHPTQAEKLNLKRTSSEKFSCDQSQFKSLPLILFSSALAENGKPLTEELVRLEMNPSSLTEVDSFDLALEFCQQRMGAAVLPDNVAYSQIESGKLMKLQISKLKSIGFSKHRICISQLQSDFSEPLIDYLSQQILNSPHWRHLS